MSLPCVQEVCICFTEWRSRSIKLYSSGCRLVANVTVQHGVMVLIWEDRGKTTLPTTNPTLRRNVGTPSTLMKVAAVHSEMLVPVHRPKCVTSCNLNIHDCENLKYHVWLEKFNCCRWLFKQNSDCIQVVAVDPLGKSDSLHRSTKHTYLKWTWGF